MRLRFSALTTAALVAVSVPALSDAAQARGFGGFGMHGGFGHLGGWGGGWGGSGWDGVGLGLATGALIGAALATPYYGYGYPYAFGYGYPYAYGYGYPAAYDYGYYGYAPAYSVGYVGPFWRRHFWAHRHYGYGLGWGGYRARVRFAHAAYRPYGGIRFAGGVHHTRFR
jgi:hypothetical protein